VLISRTQSKLEAVAAELEEVYGVHTRVVAADLSKAGPEMFTKIGAALEGLEVGWSACAAAGAAVCARSCARLRKEMPQPSYTARSLHTGLSLLAPLLLADSC
jgi:hypothetical protein